MHTHRLTGLLMQVTHRFQSTMSRQAKTTARRALFFGGRFREGGIFTIWIRLFNFFPNILKIFFLYKFFLITIYHICRLFRGFFHNFFYILIFFWPFWNNS